MVTTIRSANGRATHALSCRVVNRFGRRHIAMCGISIRTLAPSDGPVTCARCLAKSHPTPTEV